MRVYPPLNLTLFMGEQSTDIETGDAGNWISLVSVPVEVGPNPALSWAIELAGDVAVSGQWRIVLDGGIYSNTTIIERALPIGSNIQVSATRTMLVALNTEYIATLQVVSDSSLLHVTVDALSNPRHGAFLRVVV